MGVALHLWRSSLGLDAEGDVRVRIFRSPDSKDLEQLPDAAVFVLRAVLQLAPAQPALIEESTMLRSSQVAEVLRYALARGYLDREGEKYTVAWTWFREITRFLQRRHLLVVS
jgi:hypothetical protein